MGADVTWAWAFFVKNGRRLDNPTGAQFETWVVQRNSGDRFEMIVDRNAVLSWNGEDFTWFSSGNPRSLHSVHVQKPNFGFFAPGFASTTLKIRGSESDLHGFTPPAMGKHGNFQKDWGGEVDQSWPVHLQNLGMTKWCCKMKAISRQFIATELPGFPGNSPKR